MIVKQSPLFIKMDIKKYLKKFKRFTKQSINWRGRYNPENLEKYSINPRSYKKLLSYVADDFLYYGNDGKNTIFPSVEEYKKMSKYDRGRQAVALQEFLKNANTEKGLVNSADKLQFIDYIAQSKIDEEIGKQTLEPISFKKRENRVKDFLINQKVSPFSYFKEQYINTYVNLLKRFNIEEQVIIKVSKVLNKMSPGEIYKLQNSGLDFTDISNFYNATMVASDTSMLNDLAEYLIKGVFI